MKKTTLRALLSASTLAAALLLALGLSACQDTPDVETGAETQPPVTESGTETQTEAETDSGVPEEAPGWDYNIYRAKKLQNKVQSYFTDDQRMDWHLQNENVIINYNLHAYDRDTGEPKVLYDSITNTAGVPYISDTGSVYLVDVNGDRWTTAKTGERGNFNIYELGYYYNNAHVHDMQFRGGHVSLNTTFLAFRLDSTLHMYSDKLNIVQHLVYNSSNTKTGLAGYGQTYEVEESRVLQFVAKDAAGLHYNYDEVDWNTAEYVGFDIDGAGIIGTILLVHENSGKLTVTLENGLYVVDQSNTHDATKSFDSSFHLYFGQRLYTDDSHDFTAFLAEAEAERHPLSPLNTGLALEYDALRGAYKGSMPTVPWGSPEKPNDYSVTHINLTGDDMNRKLYCYTDCGFGALECAVMLDENSSLLPIALEVTKNFNGENEEPLYDPGDPHYGNTYVPITLMAGEKKNFSLVGLNMNWGNEPIKQLSSVQFYSPYYHLSLGPWECNCITPDGVNGKDYWNLPDFRSVGSGTIQGSGQYPAHSVIKMMCYEDKYGVKSEIENTVDIIDSSGPIYADITMNYTTLDGRVTLSYRHAELPNEDENRTLYSLRLAVNEAVSFDNFREQMSLLYFDGRGLQYGTLSYLNKDNEVTYKTIMTQEIKNPTEIVKDDYYVLGNGTAPYFGYLNAVNGDITQPNFACVIRGWDIVIGGEAFTGNFIVHDYMSGATTAADLSLDLGEVTLQPGDYINIDYILMPWGSRASENDASIQKVRQDTVIDPFKITASKGTVIEDTYVPKVQVDENGMAEFTVTGGASNGVVRVYGLKNYAKPVIKVKDGAVWKEFNVASAKGYDGYMVYADDDGTYSIAFAFDMDQVGEEGYSFRVTAGE